MHREPFDPTREFVAVHPLRVGGKLLARGQPFNKTLVAPYRLRQMYETRLLEHGARVEAARGNKWFARP
jgi:hypothetical protein